MAILFRDSFAGYRTADLPTRYPGGSGGTTIGTAVLPPNSQAGAQVLTVGGSGYNLSSNYGPKARMIAGIRHYRTGTGGYVIQFSNAASGFSVLVAGLYLDNTGSFIYGPGGSFIASGPTIPNNEWHHYEFDVTFGTASNATVHCYLDGNPVPYMSATGLTLTAATASYVGLPNGIYNGAPFDTNTSSGYWADYYLNDGTGPAPENAPFATQGLGGAKMAFAVANGAGIISNWTPNGAGTIWQCINQIPQDGDTTYASDATPGDQYQCTFSTIPAMQTLIDVQLSTYARTDDAGPRSYQSGFYSGGVYGYSGVNQFLSGSYNYIQDEFPLNPVTGLAWSPGDLATLQFGAKLTT